MQRGNRTSREGGKVGKLVEFLGDIERESNVAVLTPEAVAQAARRAGLTPEEIDAVASGDAAKIAHAIGVADPSVAQGTFALVMAPEEEEEEKEPDEDDEK
jgi:hypothetical protein